MYESLSGYVDSLSSPAKELMGIPTNLYCPKMKRKQGKIYRGEKQSMSSRWKPWGSLCTSLVHFTVRPSPSSKIFVSQGKCFTSAFFFFFKRVILSFLLSCSMRVHQMVPWGYWWENGRRTLAAWKERNLSGAPKLKRPRQPCTLQEGEKEVHPSTRLDISEGWGQDVPH